MEIQIIPQKLGIVVMKNTSDIDPVATRQIRETRQVELARVRASHTFRPILQVRFSTRGNTSDLIAMVRFDYAKDGLTIWSWPQPQMFERDATFYPDIVLNLAPYKRSNDMVGTWGVSAGIAIIRERQLGAIAQGRHHDFLMSLLYEDIASFQWEIVRALQATQLAPTGERVREQWEHRTERVISIDEI